MNNQPTDEQIENSTVLGDELFPTIFEMVEEESEERDADPIGVIFSLWVYMTHVLFEYGWTADDLIKDVAWHAAKDKGPMQ